MIVRTVTAPAYWASALVNGDQSGLTTDEVIALNAWRKRELFPGESVVGIEDDAEPRFTKFYWLYDNRFVAGDVLEYQTLRGNDVEKSDATSRQ